MATSLRNAKVKFFELTVLPDGRRAKSAEWQDRLGRVDRNLPAIKYLERDLDGLVGGAEGNLYLSLAIDRLIASRQRNKATRKRDGLAPREGWDSAEETIVVFFERNIFGMIQSSQGAPSHAAVAQWLSLASPPGADPSEARWGASPVVNSNTYKDILNSSSIVKGYTFVFRPGDVVDEGIDSTVVGNLMTQARGEYTDGALITVSVSAGRMKDRRQNYEKLRSQVEKIATNIGFRASLKSAHASISDSEEKAAQQVNLFEESITTSVEVPWSVQESFGDIAAAAIRSAYAEARPSLLRSVPKQ